MCLWYNLIGRFEMKDYVKFLSLSLVAAFALSGCVDDGVVEETIEYDQDGNVISETIVYDE